MVIDAETYERYLDALLRGDSGACRETVERLLDEDIEPIELYVGLFQRSLYRIGELWERGEISVAVEHLSSAITERLLALAYPRLFRRERRDRSVIISCAANELHQIGGQIIADIFEQHGWDSHFIGADTPLEDLVALVQHKQPDLVGLSLAVYFNLPNLLEALGRLEREFPSLPVIVGGHAFAWGGARCLDAFPKVRLVPDLDSLEAYLAAC